MNLLLKALVLPCWLLSLTACAQTPASLPTAEKSRVTGGLTAPVLYGFLLGEIASQRGDKRLSAEVYLDLAQRTRDARVVKRAAELAAHAQDNGRAMQATRLWLELEPDASPPRHALVLLLVKAGELDAAVQETAVWLQRAGAVNTKENTKGAAAVWTFLPGLYARAPKPEAGLEALTRVAGKHPDVAEASFSVARLALQVGQAARALLAVDAALKLRPDWERAALLRAQVLAEGMGNSPAALEGLARFVQRYPEAYEARFAYAGGLARAHRVLEAGAAYASLLQDAPEDALMSTAYFLDAGGWALRTGALDLAEQRLTRALALGERHRAPNRAAIVLRLGELAERRHQDEEALRWYAQAMGHEGFAAGVLKAVVVLGRLGRIEEGRRLLASVEADDEADRIELIRAEAQMLREGRDATAALAVLDTALGRYPDHADLLYDHALTAEGVGRFDLAEQGLRRLIALKPRHAHAYNALGYTLADRLNRPVEAIALLETALSLSPGDAFILDSLGWAHFKAGHLDEAIRLLREAYAQMSDPEVAAHLGDALWAKGLEAEARSVWQDALKTHPDNAPLRKAVGRK
jgi:tetratricopeptide (TPR) repeat protein